MYRQTSYDTAEIAPRDRFAYWRDAVCESYVLLGCSTLRSSGFSGSLRITRHSNLAISHVGGSAHWVERRRRDISSASEEFFLLSLQTRNTSRITQFGHSSLLNPGDMALYDSSHPYTLELSDGFAKNVVQLPKSRLLARLPNAQMMAGVRIDGSSEIGKLVRENILAFSGLASDPNRTLQALAQDTLIDLIATGLAAGLGDTAELSSPEQHMLLRARSFIRNNLGDAELDRNRVAGEMRISVRRLNAIFAKDDSSIADEIRKQRLAAVMADLRDPRCAALSISEIALKNGFENFSHFSTLFRTSAGCSPREYRARPN
jgi:AraC-like DNA-binding protein